MYDKLKAYEESGKAIRVGAAGAGWMGSGFVAAVKNVPGMEVSVLADEEPGLAKKVLVELGGISADSIVETDSPGDAAEAIRAGKRVITGDITLASKLDPIDIVTDVTPSPASGAETAFTAIRNGKAVVLINIEADVAVGPALKTAAAQAGVMYTVSSGDEPGCLMELWDFVRSLGYEPIVIGKGKNNPLNPDATPDTVRESAEKADKDPFQVASYVDGTKTMFEMSCVANATGCRPMRPGMAGPEADTDTVTEIFALKEDGGMTPFPGVVDFVQGSAMSGGVFITVRIPDERVQADLQYLKVGKRNYCTFFRPYHLWFLEAPISIARAFFYNESTLVPLDQPVADVATVAKKDLAVGDTLDAFGGYTFFGRMYTKEECMKANALPVGLAPGAKLSKPVKKGDIITWDHAELDETSVVVKLRREQDGSFRTNSKGKHRCGADSEIIV
jgi:predicted homoserine dehydrogenase-like protein